MLDDFDATVEPLRISLVGLIDAGRQMREGHRFLAAADSEAMLELSHEARYADAWGDRPVFSAHAWSTMLLAAAEDHLRSITRIIVGDPVIFSPQVLLRAAVEAAGRSEWFSEPGIGVHRRVARWQTERIYNATEMRRLGVDAKSAHIEKTIVETAVALGFRVIQGKKNRHPHVEEIRPSTERVFRTVSRDLENDSLGHVLHSFLSAVAHATNYGLITQILEQGPLAPSGGHSAILGMTSDQANEMLGIGTFVYAMAAESHRVLHGWDDPPWVKSRVNALRMLSVLFPGGNYTPVAS